MGVFKITEKNIDQVVTENAIVLIDFYADWCNPCKVFAGTFLRASELNSDLYFGAVNSETELNLSADFNIKSIPTLVILKNEEIIFNESGLISYSDLLKIIDKSRQF